MMKVFEDLMREFEFTENLRLDTYNFLIKHNRFRVAEHTLRVADMCRVLARQYGLNEDYAETAGLLHDIGGVYPNSERVEIAKSIGLTVLQEEENLPLIIHQRISEVMAREMFKVNSKEILSAIGCHTTLKSSASQMDMLLFVADKLQWDQDGIPPYYEAVSRATDVSLKLAAFEYINYLLGNKDRLLVVHPWLEAAYKELKETVRI